MGNGEHRGGIIERSPMESLEDLSARGFEPLVVVAHDATEVEVPGLGKVEPNPDLEPGSPEWTADLVQRIADESPAGYGYSYVHGVGRVAPEGETVSEFELVLGEVEDSTTVLISPLG